MQNLYREVKGMKSKFIKCMTILSVAMMLSACGGETDSNKTVDNETVDKEVVDDSEVVNESDLKETNAETKKNEKDIIENGPFLIDNVEWNVESGSIAGQRVVTLDYTNNTGYPMVDFQIKFRPKDNLNDDEKSILNSLISEYSLSEEQIDELYVGGEIEQLLEPGEKANAVACMITVINEYLYDIELYELMEPDMAYFSYITNDDKLHSAYYDFKLQKYSDDGEIGIYEWSDNEINNSIPKPEVKVIKILYQNETNLSFDAFGVERDYYLDYVKKCKEFGFDTIDYEYDISFRALRSDGESIMVIYNEDAESMYVTVDL